MSPEHEALLRACVANPHDEATRFALADYLNTEGLLDDFETGALRFAGEWRINEKPQITWQFAGLSYMRTRYLADRMHFTANYGDLWYLVFAPLSDLPTCEDCTETRSLRPAKNNWRCWRHFPSPSLPGAYSGYAVTMSFTPNVVSSTIATSWPIGTISSVGSYQLPQLPRAMPNGTVVWLPDNGQTFVTGGRVALDPSGNAVPVAATGGSYPPIGTVVSADPTSRTIRVLITNT